MKRKIGTLVRLMVVLSFFLGLSGSLRHSAQAVGETCTWEGDISTDWYEVENWSGCTDSGGVPKVPDTNNDVVIPAYTTYYPVLTNYQDLIQINTLNINSAAQLTIDEQTTISANQFNNSGTINIEEVTGHNLHIEAPFNNNGTVNIGSQASLILHMTGTHTGSFSGRQLSFSKSASTRINDFESDSNIDVQVFYVGDNNTINIDGQFNCTNDLYINNSKVTILTANLINLGTVHNNSGELIIRMAGETFEPGDDVTITEGETLSGAGTIQANLINAGIVSPGTSPGIITVDGDYTQDPAGTLEIELGGTTLEPDYDQLIVTGSASLDGTLDTSLFDGFAPALGQSFTIMTYESQTGEFSSPNLPNLDPGLTWEIEYSDTALVLHVMRSIGSISGTVTYLGNEAYNEVTVAVFTDPDDPPFKATKVTSTTGEYPYTLSELPDDTYYVGALMDLDSDNQPDPDEPFSWYVDDVSGELKPIIISGENTDYGGIDFNLQDPGNIEGTVTYDGLAGVTGPISVSTHRNLNIEEKPVAIADDIQSGETYLIEGLSAGKYYISAFMDLDSSGGPPGEGEPLVWYDGNKDGLPDQVNVPPGTTLQGINIVIAAPAIISESSTIFTSGQEGSFTVETTGHPTPEITLQGDLPDGVSFIDNEDGTGTLSGTPAEGSQGTYVLNITASNGVDPEATQEFTLTVEEGDFKIFLPLIVR